MSKRLSIVVVVALVASLTVLAARGPVAAELPTSMTTVDSGMVNIHIPDPGSIMPILEVAQTGRVADVDVGIRIDHTFVADLDITLRSPDGTILDLTSDNGAQGDDFGTATDCTSMTGLTVFDDSAATSITDIVDVDNPFVGSFRPEAALSALENETLNGTWTLGITDDDIGVSGTLVCWTLIFTYAEPPAAADVCNQLAWEGFDGHSATRQIWVANADGQGRAEIVTPGSGTDPIFNFRPAWSPDGTRIAWDGSGQIWVADPDGTNRIEISSVSSGTDPTSNSAPAWSPDGTRMAWEGDDGTTDQIWVADADGTNRVEISSVGSGTDPIFNFNPAWSPDGTRIAWDGIDGTASQIYVADPDGTNRVEISSVDSGTDPTGNAFPVWSPDSSRIAWYGSDGTGTQIYVADPDGTNRALISTVAAGTDPTSNIFPAWSPDSSRIAWSGSDGTATQIWVADPDGTKRVLVSDVSGGTDPTGNLNVDWSPDGTRLAWEGSDGTTDQVYVANPDGTSREEISSVELGFDPASNGGPDWRNWNSQLALSTTAIGLKDGQAAIATATVTNTGPCPSTNIVITGLHLPCVAAVTVSVTAGSVTNATWTIPNLAAGTTATATLSGTSAGGACSSTLALTAVPVTAGPVNATWGGTGRVCPTPTPPFVDVPATSFALADIACIYGLGITTGTSATTYSPFDNVTREQMAAFLARLWRALGNPCPTGATPFTDVSATSFAFADIACIYGLGITTGTSATTYSPANFVTREQMAAFLARLWRALGNPCPNPGGPFTDVLPTSFAFADIACIFALGVTTGTSATTYSPADFVTREQMAAFLARLWRIA